MSYNSNNKKFDNISDKYNFQKFSSNPQNFSSSQKYNNPKLSVSSKSSLESSKEDDNISVSSKISLNDSEVSISNKSDAANNESDNISEHKSDHSLSDTEKSFDEKLPTKERIKNPLEKNNFSFEKQSKTYQKNNESLFKYREKEKLEEKLNYSIKREKKNDYENYKPKEQKNAPLFATNKIFNEIKQINSEIDDLEKELEKNFKFYQNSLN